MVEVKAAMVRFWSPAVGDTGSTDAVTAAMNGAKLSATDLLHLRLWLAGGGVGTTGERRAALRDIVDLYATAFSRAPAPQPVELATKSSRR